jgi:error-prone DNA polymerase
MHMRSIHDFAGKSGLDTGALSALARAGAFSCFGIERRRTLWAVLGQRPDSRERHGRKTGAREGRKEHDANANRGRANEAGADIATAPEAQRAAEAETELGIDMDEPPPEFPHLDERQSVLWDYRHALHSTQGHPMEAHRYKLTAEGYPDAAGVSAMDDGQYVCYAGLVICRQRPDTAGGTVFFTLEDETGFVNLIVHRKTFSRYRGLLLTASFLGVCGTLQARGGTAHILVHSCFPAPLPTREYHHAGRDFH